MENPQRTALRKCRVRLVNDLLIDEMFDAIEMYEIFTPIMLECIKAKESRPEKVRAFLDYLQRRGPDAFEKFLQVLRESGHNSVVSYVLLEYNALLGQGIPRLNAQNNNEIPNPPQVLPNIFHTQETQALGQSQEAQGSSVPVEGQGSSQETQWSEGDEEMLDLGEVEPEISDMDLGSGSSGLPTGVQESETSATQPGCSSRPSSSSSSNTQEYNRNESSNSLSSSFSVNVGYTGNLSEEYQMESDPRGLLLIINNRDFCPGMNDREGTDVDCEKLKKLFIKLGFGVDVRTNLTALEILANLNHLSQLEQLQDVDSLTVAIFTHGSEERLYGVDGHCIGVNDVLEPFTSDRCQALHHKPKFFIINACRGDSEDKGSLPYDQGEQTGVVTVDVKSMGPAQSPPFKAGYRIPNRKDFLIAYSTIPGHVSWRHENNGSWFIQSLVKVFEEISDKKDVMSMLVKVNNLVSKNVNLSAGVQIPAPSVMLTKTWYLNPISRQML